MTLPMFPDTQHQVAIRALAFEIGCMSNARPNERMSKLKACAKWQLNGEDSIKRERKAIVACLKLFVTSPSQK
jgi:hypothetical protein